MNPSVEEPLIISDESDRVLRLPVYGGQQWFQRMQLAYTNSEGLGTLLDEAMADPVMKKASKSSPAVLIRLQQMGFSLRHQDQVENVNSGDLANHICRIANKSIRKWFRESTIETSYGPMRSIQQMSTEMKDIPLVQYVACRLSVSVYVFGNKVQPRHYGPLLDSGIIGLFVEDSYKSKKRMFHVLEVVAPRKPPRTRMDIDKAPSVRLATYRTHKIEPIDHSQYYPPADKALLAITVLKSVINKAVLKDPHDHELGLGTYKLMQYEKLADPDHMPRDVWTTTRDVAKAKHNVHPFMETNHIRDVVIGAGSVKQMWKDVVDDNFDQLWDDAEDETAKQTIEKKGKGAKK
ncbi:hypothetical protein BG000_005578 [Podila horticola]|nr:hypothetical protein BG000_005578 [Podila horticola]